MNLFPPDDSHRLAPSPRPESWMVKEVRRKREAAPRPVDPNVRAQDVPRLSAQCEQVLAWLRAGERLTATVVFPRGIQRLAGRVHDLRSAGYDVRSDYCKVQTCAVYWMEGGK